LFEEGQECDVFLLGQNVTNMFTKQHPLYLDSVEWTILNLTTKNNPTNIFVNWIYLCDDERKKVHTDPFTTVNPYFTASYYEGVLTFTENENFKELHFVAKRIQKWYKKYLELLKTKRYFLACRISIQNELIYLPPYGKFFPGGIEYQNALASFETLRTLLMK
jgi:hypothetical protein